jgi:two-component system phosphate regulon response regulator PhoB
MKATVFVVEDDPDIRDIVASALERDGHDPEPFSNAEDALSAALARPPDAIVLDVMLPGMDGLEALRRLKASAAAREIPVLLVTARGEDADVVSGLELGADDYVVKPFSAKVLAARVRSAIRRARAREASPLGASTRLVVGPLEMDSERHEVRVEGAPVDLSSTEFALLELLMRNPGIAFTRSRIIELVKGEDYAATDRSVDVQVLGLRRKLGPAGSLVETLRGVGYRLKDDR